MQYPKRRRLNDASSSVSKPFKSPLRRPPTANAASNPGQKQEPEQTTASTESRSATASSPLTASHAPSDKSPLKNPHTPKRSLDTTVSDSSPIVPSPSSSSARELIASLRKQESVLLSRLITLRRDLDTVSQALKIEQAGQDEELRQLIEKWKGVSREAAEELFVGARDKVNRMGGVGVWKERVRSAKMRRMEWDAMEEEGRDGEDEDEDDGKGREDIEDEREKRRREIEDEIRAGEADDDYGREREEESDGDEETFTMDMMLKSLNIDLDAIGYDKVNQRWID